jgi:hypothetical protein
MNHTKRNILCAQIALACAGTLSAQSRGRDQEGPLRPNRMNGWHQTMGVYEPFGLAYNQEKAAYCYNGKVVGLFVDPEARGTVFLSPNGEIHLKTIRDTAGKLTRIAELSRQEYTDTIAAIDAEIVALRKQMEEFRGGMEERREAMEEQQETMRNRPNNNRPPAPPPPRRPGF